MTIKLSSIFKRKKKSEYNPFTGEEEVEEAKDDKASFTNYLSDTLGSLGKKTVKTFTPDTKIKISFLRRGKRLLAGGLCLIYLITGLFAFPNPISLLGFATFFVMIDYLWKTRKIEWVNS